MKVLSLLIKPIGRCSACKWLTMFCTTNEEYLVSFLKVKSELHPVFGSDSVFINVLPVTPMIFKSVLKLFSKSTTLDMSIGNSSSAESEYRPKNSTRGSRFCEIFLKRPFSLQQCLLNKFTLEG